MRSKDAEGSYERNLGAQEAVSVVVPPLLDNVLASDQQYADGTVPGTVQPQQAPSPRYATWKAVRHFLSVNESVNADEVTDVPYRSS